MNDQIAGSSRFQDRHPRLPETVGQARDVLADLRYRLRRRRDELLAEVAKVDQQVAALDLLWDTTKHHGTQAIEPTFDVAQPLPYVALDLIIAAAGGECERSTSGIGSCFSADGSDSHDRTADAPYGADRACNACIAHAAKVGNNIVTEKLVEARAQYRDHEQHMADLVQQGVV